MNNNNEKKPIEVTDGNHFLSPRSRSIFSYKGKTFNSVYQFVFYCKIKASGVNEKANEVLSCKNNKELDNIKKNYKIKNNHRWKKNLNSYYYVGNREKFAQNKNLAQELINTLGHGIKIKHYYGNTKEDSRTKWAIEAVRKRYDPTLTIEDIEKHIGLRKPKVIKKKPTLK
jgi:hypothetical protein